MNRFQAKGAVAALVFAMSSIASAQQGPNPVPEAPAATQAPNPQVPPLPAAIQAPAPGVSTKPGAGLSPEDFARLLNSNLPLNPRQVEELNRAQDAVKRARSARPGPAPKPVSVTARVTLAAGAPPAIIRLDADTVTTLVFNDVTGAPWRVTEVRAGGRDLLDIPKRESLASVPTNMFTVAPLDDHISTNLVVFLEGAPAPVTMLVATNQKEVDFRVDVSVQARGPAAVMPVISRGLAESVSPELTSMVSGLTPGTAKPLKVVASDVADVSAWVIGERMYVRTRANVLAPPVPKDGKVATGADGTKVYELPHAPEVLLMQGGSVGRLKLGGFPPPTMSQLVSK
jgi:intracellular multiplication protein IcmK